MTTILPASKAKRKLAAKLERARRRKLNVTGAKFEANDSQRIASLVIALSSRSNEHLISLCGLKMCNERRAAQKILDWRNSNNISK
jgi:mannitol/fructose-specific phosphotransferase system IIA component